MNYDELIVKALKGRSVMALAKKLGVPQPTMYRYVSGERMPDFSTALKMAREAEVDPGEAFEAFATADELKRSRQFKLQMGFVQTDLLLALATLSAIPLLYIM